jgi:hypothetical protein
MSSDQITYAFCKDSLRYAHQILGDDAFMDEIAFIRRKYLPVQNIQPDTTVKLSVPEVPTVLKESEEAPDSKNVVIQNERTLYKRSILPSEQVCTSITKEKTQCTLRRSKSSTSEKPFCSRHMK